MKHAISAMPVSSTVVPPASSAQSIGPGSAPDESIFKATVIIAGEAMI